MLELPPLSLYIHIPWCLRKCPYCDFNSHKASQVIPESDYITALLQDFASDLSYIQGREIQTIFFGGGTPSLFSAEGIERILRGVEQLSRFSSSIEITLEANPGTAEAKKFAGFREAGVNRLSLGIQSFDDLKLQKLGRVHNSDQAKNAIELACIAGFDNFNLDFMYGLPGQTTDQAIEDLQQAMAFRPNHLSWYQLTIEPNTEFFSRPPKLPPEKSLQDMQKAGLEFLLDHKLGRYEVSAFGKRGKRSAHNLNYWQFGDYLGIGAGAHSKITQPENNRILRLRKLRQPSHYLESKSGYIGQQQEVPEAERALEYLMNALRLRDGFEKSQLTARTGLPFGQIANKVEYLLAQELLVSRGDNISTSTRGYQLLDSVLQEFL